MSKETPSEMNRTREFLREASLPALEESLGLADKLANYFGIKQNAAERGRVLWLKSLITSELRRRLFPRGEDQGQDRDAGNQYSG